jgi:hypothetical protein
MVGLLDRIFRADGRCGGRLAEFGAQDGNVGRGIDADPHAIAVHCQYGEDDVPADLYFLAGLPAEDEHGKPPP